MRLLTLAAALAFVLPLVPIASAQPWTCAFPPRAFVCAGEYTLAPDSPDCGVTGMYAWATTGTSVGAWGMACDGWRAMGAGGTVANTTAAGVQWYSSECFFVYVVEYMSHQWTRVPVCAVGAPPDGIDWGHLTP